MSDCVVVFLVPLDGKFLSMLAGLAEGVLKDKEEMVDVLCVAVDSEW